MAQIKNVRDGAFILEKLYPGVLQSDMLLPHGPEQKGHGVGWSTASTTTIDGSMVFSQINTGDQIQCFVGTGTITLTILSVDLAPELKRPKNIIESKESSGNSGSNESGGSLNTISPPNIWWVDFSAHVDRFFDTHTYFTIISPIANFPHDKIGYENGPGVAPGSHLLARLNGEFNPGELVHYQNLTGSTGTFTIDTISISSIVDGLTTFEFTSLDDLSVLEPTAIIYTLPTASTSSNSFENTLNFLATRKPKATKPKHRPGRTSYAS